MNNLITDLGEIGDVVEGNAVDIKKPNVDGTGKKEEDFTVARLFINRMKSAVKSLVVRLTSVETAEGDTKTKLDLTLKDLQAGQLTISQHEAKVKAMGIAVK